MADAYHHYKGSELDRTEMVERKVVDLLLESEVPDAERESSVTWELKHSAGVTQLGRILAQKRNVDTELAEVACVLHDIHVIVHGTYKDHAKLGAVIAEKMLREMGGFSDEEIEKIVRAIAEHSDKDTHSEDALVELVKDADVFDCSLYKGAENYYKVHKKHEVFEEYVERVKKVRAELGLQGKLWR